jgi:hypothetical protein
VPRSQTSVAPVVERDSGTRTLTSVT